MTVISVKCGDVIKINHIFGPFIDIVHKHKSHHWIAEIKLNQKSAFYFPNFENWPFLTLFDLTCSAASRSTYHSVGPGPDQPSCFMSPPPMRQTRTLSGGDLFRRCVVALNAYVDACKADPFHATFTAFKAGVKKYVRDRRVWMLIVMCMLRLVICVTLLMHSCILHRIHAHVVYLNGASSVLLFRFCLLSISSASDFSFLL